MKNTTNTVRTICEIGIFAALGFVFDELQGAIFAGVFPSGGSIGFAMIAVLIIAYRRGLIPALLTGFVMGAFDLLTKAYVIHPMQVMLDYIFPYMLVGLAGLFKPLFDKATTKGNKILWLLAGTLVGGLLKFTSHYLAGIFFWSNPAYFEWGLNDMSPYLYCFIYNIAFVGPSIIITGALLSVVFAISPRILTNQVFIEENQSNSKNFLPAIISTVLIATGAFLFTFFLFKHINSFYYKSSSQKYYFDQDSMVIFVIGIFLFVTGLIGLFTFFKNKYNYLILSTSLLITSGISFVYGLAKLIEKYMDKEDPKTYWIWFAISGGILLCTTALFVTTLILRRRNKQL